MNCKSFFFEKTGYTCPIKILKNMLFRGVKNIYCKILYNTRRLICFLKEIIKIFKIIHLYVLTCLLLLYLYSFSPNLIFIFSVLLAVAGGGQEFVHSGLELASCASQKNPLPLFYSSNTDNITSLMKNLMKNMAGEVINLLLICAALGECALFNRE